MNSKEALNKLVQGNKDYVNGQNSNTDKHQFIANQRPFAIILGCSDSRAPIETIFNQCLGSLFVIRVAGNIATPTQIGSMEFACQNFGSPLIVVLGHTGCGAIEATIGCLDTGTKDLSPNLASIVDHLTPTVKKAVANSDGNQAELVSKSTRLNIESTVRQLKQQSTVLSELINEDELDIVGAEYSIKTGKVDFYLND